MNRPKPTFVAFYEAHLTRIYAFVFFRVGGRKEIAEDLVQEVFLKAFEAYDRYDPAVSEFAWIYTIARNHLATYFSRQRETLDVEDVADDVRFSKDARDQLARSFEEGKLLDALNTLPSEQAELIQKKYLEGWSFDDLAVHFQKSSGSLRVQCVRTLRTLSRLLERYRRDHSSL